MSPQFSQASSSRGGVEVRCHFALTVAGLLTSNKVNGGRTGRARHNPVLPHCHSGMQGGCAAVGADFQNEAPYRSAPWLTQQFVCSTHALRYPSAVTSTGLLHPQMLDLDATPVFIQVLGDQPAVAMVWLVLAAQQAAFIQHFP